jgi:hypothetical protein
VVGYILSAFAGIALIALVLILLGRWLSRRGPARGEVPSKTETVI